MDEGRTENRTDHSREHLANERTLLAWTRTSIGLMAFGFVLERFAFFIRRLVLLEKIGLKAAGRVAGGQKSLVMGETAFHTSGFSAVLGIVFVVFGIVLAVFAFVRYREVEKEIEQQRYRPKAALNMALTAFVLVAGIFLLIDLIKSV